MGIWSAWQPTLGPPAAAASTGGSGGGRRRRRRQPPARLVLVLCAKPHVNHFPSLRTCRLHPNETPAALAQGAPSSGAARTRAPRATSRGSASSSSSSTRPAQHPPAGQHGRRPARGSAVRPAGARQGGGGGRGRPFGVSPGGRRQRLHVPPVGFRRPESRRQEFPLVRSARRLPGRRGERLRGLGVG